MSGELQPSWRDGGTFEDLDKTTADRVDLSISQAIIAAVTEATADLRPFETLASWASGEYYRLPIELFTVNYDTLIEEALEAVAAPYFDGFVGSKRGRFRAELVEATDPARPGALPASFVRVWKLHGSITWEVERDTSQHRVVRLGHPAPPGRAAAIYPSDEKYDASRRVPFVV